ncbi:MAG: toll/interleukin-1 receptor domain-containing protein [Pseudomonadales bacterium]
MPDHQSRHELKNGLKILLKRKKDISWAYIRINGDELESYYLKVIIMPKNPYFSQLEQLNLTAEIEQEIGCWVFLEDERAIHPSLYDEIDSSWDLLFDGDPARRSDIRSKALGHWFPISVSYEECRSLPHETQIAVNRDDNNRQNYNISYETAGTAGRSLLDQCCKLHRLCCQGQPKTIHQAFDFLVAKASLEAGCAERLAGWVTCVLSRSHAEHVDDQQHKAALEIDEKDLDAFYEAVDQAASGVSPQAVGNDFTFDPQAAVEGVGELLSVTNDPDIEDVLSGLKRRLAGRIIKFGSAEQLQRPIISLLVFQHSNFDDQLPARIASALYGDGSLVYDIGAALAADQPLYRSEAVWGRPSAYAPIGTGSLPEFLQRNGCGVIYCSIAERVEPTHLARLANIAAGTASDANGKDLSVRNTCLLICGQWAVGTPDVIGTTPEDGDCPPDEFVTRVDHLVALHYPEQLNASVRSRFTIETGSIWRRYKKLVSAGLDTEPLVKQISSPMSTLESPPLTNDHEVQSVYRLIQVKPETGKYDFFISYSWTRTKPYASELTTTLKSRGHRVFFDRDDLDPNIPMEKLLPDLVKAVRSSSAVLLFPVQLKNPFEDGSTRSEEMLKKGLLIRVPTVAGPSLADWSWQTLEHMASTRKLVIEYESKLTYAIAYGGSDPNFIRKTYRSSSELADICESYLDHISRVNRSILQE